VRQQESVGEGQPGQQHRGGLGGGARGAEQQQGPQAGRAAHQQGEAGLVGQQQHRHQLQQQEATQPSFRGGELSCWC